VSNARMNLAKYSTSYMYCYCTIESTEMIVECKYKNKKQKINLIFLHKYSTLLWGMVISTNMVLECK
jgi:hypothetical protein